jgi:hypothetical protein
MCHASVLASKQAAAGLMFELLYGDQRETVAHVGALLWEIWEERDGLEDVGIDGSVKYAGLTIILLTSTKW